MSLSQSKQRAGRTRGTGHAQGCQEASCLQATLLESSSCPALPSPARPSCCLFPSLGETDAWPLPVPKGLTLRELHVKWSEPDSHCSCSVPQKGQEVLKVLEESCDSRLALAQLHGQWLSTLYSPKGSKKTCFCDKITDVLHRLHSTANLEPPHTCVRQGRPPRFYKDSEVQRGSLSHTTRTNPGSI